MAVLAPLVFPTDPLRIVGAPELWPGEDPAFPLGTDSLGRDILAMIVHGARATLLIGLFASAVATLIGVTRRRHRRLFRRLGRRDRACARPSCSRPSPT